MLIFFCLIVAFTLVGHKYSKSKFTKMIHNIKLILCVACVFQAYLPLYLALNYNLECEEPSCIIYFLG